MEALIGLLGLAAGITSLVCLIIVLTKLFPAKGALWGIFGIICGIYTFIWGWQNVEQQGIKKVMLVWTVAFIISIVVRVAAIGLES